jgi:hypothetical protein
MRTQSKLILLGVACFLFSSCKPQSPEGQFVRQEIPIQIQSGKPVSVEINSLSGNGVNDVGIRCPPEVWKVLTNGTRAITVRLKSSNKANTEIGGVDPRTGGTSFLGYISNVHYLFYISGERDAEASVEIAFPNTPQEATRAVIIICKTPADTGL